MASEDDCQAKSPLADISEAKEMCGAGFIGSNITERLLKEGYFVRVLDNFSSGKRENLSFAQGLSPKGTVPEDS